MVYKCLYPTFGRLIYQEEIMEHGAQLVLLKNVSIKATKVSLIVTGEEVEKCALSGEHILSCGSFKGCVC